jgi:hypothetical protein
LGGQSPSYYAKADDLDDYVPTSTKGQANGVASLGTDGKVPESQIGTHKHGQGDISGLEDAISDMTEIAQGKCACYVFDTVDALDTWLGNNENTAKLKTGDIFLIRAVDVPDYWWDGTTKSKQQLETTKVDLSTISTDEIDTIVGS